MTEPLPDYPNSSLKPGRPRLLTIFCILTLIGSSLQAFVFLMITMSYTEFMAQVKDMDLPLPEMQIFFTGSKSFYLTGFLLLSISTIGAYLMWKLRKIGFHMYTASQVIFLATPAFYLEGYKLSVVDIVLTAIFVIIYRKFYNIMN